MIAPPTWVSSSIGGWPAHVAGGDGPTVVWLHGLGERAATFAPVIATPALAPLRHLLLDLPGHGARAAEAGPPPSIDATADQLAAWLADRPPVVVVGHSLGGVIALALAERAPARLRAVVDVEGNVALPDCTYSSQIAAHPVAEFVARGHAEVCARLRAHADPIIAGYGARMATASPVQLWRYSCDLVAASTAETSARRRAALAVPLTYVAGAPGGTCPRGRALLAEAGVRTVEIAPAGHWPFVDHPAAVAAIIAAAAG